MPNKTNGYQRKAQATIGGDRPAAAPSSISSAAWGHEGGNDITVEFVTRTGNDLPLSVQVTGKAVHVLLATNATGAPLEHGGPGRGGARGRLTGPDRPCAPVPDQRRHRGRAADDGARAR